MHSSIYHNFNYCLVIATFKNVTGPGLFKGQFMQHMVHRVTVGSGIPVKILFRKCLMTVTDAIVTSLMSSKETGKFIRGSESRCWMGPSLQRYGLSAGCRWRRRSPSVEGSCNFIYKQRWTFGSPAVRVGGQGYSKGVSISYEHVTILQDTNERTIEVRNLLTSWTPIKFRRKSLLRRVSRGVEVPVAKLV